MPNWKKSEQKRFDTYQSDSKGGILLIIAASAALAAIALFTA